MLSTFARSRIFGNFWSTWAYNGHGHGHGPNAINFFRNANAALISNFNIPKYFCCSCSCAKSFYVRKTTNNPYGGPNLQLQLMNTDNLFRASISKFSTSTNPNPPQPPTSSGDEDHKHSSENIYTIPNLLCVARIGMAPVLGYMIITSQFTSAIGIFALAGVTDLLDGWIARAIPGQSSMLGSFLDPMSDKILVGFVFVSLTYMDLIPLSLTALIIARDILLISAGFYIRYQSLDPPRTISRYFNASMPTAQLAPTFISKVNTGIQLGLVGATLLSTVITNYDVQPYLVALWYFTAGTTICSALSYIFTRNTYTILKHSKDWKAKHLSKIKKTLESAKEKVSKPK